MCQPQAEHKLMGIEIYLLETGILKNSVAPTRGKQELSDGSWAPKIFNSQRFCTPKI